MLFFDPRRYDLSRFGRYKMNKKLSLARSITGQVAAENVVAPLTGEILIEAGAKINRELAEKADNAGVNLVVLKLDDPMKAESRKVKVITNGLSLIHISFEDMKVKQTTFGELDKICKPECIFASNTSSLSITEIGKEMCIRDRLCTEHQGGRGSAHWSGERCVSSG